MQGFSKFVGLLLISFVTAPVLVHSIAIFDPRHETGTPISNDKIPGEKNDKIKRDTGDGVPADANIPTGPCQSNPCQPGETCDPSGLCLPCSAWEGRDDAPDDCGGYVSVSKPIPTKEEDSSEEMYIQPCTQESDCDLGKWCVRHPGTCESCEELKSTPEVYEIECSRFINHQKTNELHKTIAISVVTVVVLLGLSCTLAWCWRKHCRKQHPIEVNDHVETEMDKLNEEKDDFQESKGEAYSIEVADRSSGRSATTG